MGIWMATKLAAPFSHVQRLSVCRRYRTLGRDRHDDVDRTGFLPLVRNTDDAALRTQPKRDSTHVKRSGRSLCGPGAG